MEAAEAHRQAAVKEKEAKESEARRQAVRQTIASYREAIRAGAEPLQEDISNLLARLGPVSEQKIRFAKNIAKNFTGTFFRENGRCLVRAEAERLRDQVRCSLDVELYCTSSVADCLALCSYKPRLKLGRAPSSARLMLATFGTRLRAKRRGKTATAEPRTLEETTVKP